MDQPLFSILIAQYNNGRYFMDCYNSIIAQTYDNWEVIIVDDGSTDDSVEVMKKAIGDDSRFKLFFNDENKGCGYTKRRCVELANGEICGFVDPDDALIENALKEMVIIHEQYKEIALVYSDYYNCDENLKIKSEKKTSQIVNGDKNFINYNAEVLAWTTFKKSYYKLTDGISPELKRAVDQDLVLKIYEVGQFLHTPKLLYKYRIHDGGISTLQNAGIAKYWHWVVIIDAAKRRGVNFEDYFAKNVKKTGREAALEHEISVYNKSFLFKALRKLGIFRI